jgi:hypothetical protein
MMLMVSAAIRRKRLNKCLWSIFRTFFRVNPPTISMKQWKWSKEVSPMTWPKTLAKISLKNRCFKLSGI